METVAYAPAKINLGLHILGKRDDGYHDIESILMAIPWFDVVEFEFGSSFSFSCTEPNIPSDETNLCVRAVRAYEQKYEFEVDAQIHLVKTIPAGAGLGGGSSDAAAILRVLAVHYEHGSKTDLQALAATLGSDVPFFLDASVQKVSGRGERLRVISRQSYRFPFQIVVVVPDIHISTQYAYAGAAVTSHEGVDLVELVTSNDLNRWHSELVNDFEQTVLTDFPQLAKIKGALYDSGAGYASLSGSGAAVYGFFEEVGDADRAATKLAEFGHMVWAGTERDGRLTTAQG